MLQKYSRAKSESLAQIHISIVKIHKSFYRIVLMVHPVL